MEGKMLYWLQIATGVVLCFVFCACAQDSGNGAAVNLEVGDVSTDEEVGDGATEEEVGEGATDEEVADGATDEDVAGVSTEEEVADVPIVHAVTTPGMVFVPSDLVIAVGDIVSFELGGSHNAMQVDAETYDADGTIAIEGGFYVPFGGSQQVTFDEVGTYYYVCTPHAALGMKGTIAV